MEKVQADQSPKEVPLTPEQSLYAEKRIRWARKIVRDTLAQYSDAERFAEELESIAMELLIQFVRQKSFCCRGKIKMQKHLDDQLRAMIEHEATTVPLVSGHNLYSENKRISPAPTKLDELWKALELIDPRDAEIICRRNGLGEARNFETLEKVGESLGLSTERIRTLEIRGLINVEAILRGDVRRIVKMFEHQEKSKRSKGHLPGKSFMRKDSEIEGAAESKEQEKNA